MTFCIYWRIEEPFCLLNCEEVYRESGIVCGKICTYLQKEIVESQEYILLNNPQLFKQWKYSSTDFSIFLFKVKFKFAL